MILLTLRDVVRWTGGESWHCDLGSPITRLTIDSREAGPGALFVALPGTRTNGHDYVQEVWHKGAVALVRKDFPHNVGPHIRVDSPLEAMGRLLRQYIDAHEVKVVGITGSVGKTSTKELTAAVLRRQFSTTSSLGNYNTVIGLPLSFFAGAPDTTHFVAEMGMRGSGEIRRLCGIAPPDVAVITTIGESHLEIMGSIKAIQQAKGEILERLKPQGRAVLNLDNPWVRELGEPLGSRVLWFGKTEGADARVLWAQVADDGTEMEIAIRGKTWPVRIPWLGAHQAANVAAAILVGLALGLEEEEAVQGVEQVDKGRSRIHVRELGAMVVLEDFYNASPASMIAALDVLGSRTGRRVAVLGDMLELGEQEVGGHRQVGEYAQGRVDLLLAVGMRCRHLFEAAQAIGVSSHWVSSRDEAWEWLRGEIRAGDVMLVKASRGMGFEWLTERVCHLRIAP